MSLLTSNQIIPTSFDDAQKMECPICNQDKIKLIFTQARTANIRRTYESKESRSKYIIELNTALCMNCGMLFRYPMLSEEEQKKYYTNQYVEEFKLKKKIEPKFYEELKKQKKRYVKYLCFLENMGYSFKGKNILDIGCGRGWLLKIISEYDSEKLLGIEPSIKRCTEIEKNPNFNFEVKCGSLKDFTHEQLGKFDLIILTDVIEHLSDPVGSLFKIKEFLNNNGYIYIYTHSEQPGPFININKRISLVHQLYFTKRTMNLLLQKTFLEPVKMKIQGSNLHLIAKLARKKTKENYLGIVESSLLYIRYIFFKSLPEKYYNITERFIKKYYLLINLLYKR